MASDTLKHCPELRFWVAHPLLSFLGPSLMTSVPAPRTDPSLCPGKFGSSYLRQVEGLGAAQCYLSDCTIQPCLSVLLFL
jgi:hypothetical protein